MSPHPIALVLGAGPRIGAAIAERFASNGYKVAITARKGTNSITENGYLSLKADFSDPTTVPPVFEAVTAKFGAAPSVVIYNAATMTPPSKDLFSIPAANFVADLNVNTVSAYVAAQEAVKGWATLPAATKRVFIFTGNMQNTAVLPMPALLTLGVGKSASAHWIGLADSAYAAEGYRFIYADERLADGQPMGANVGGPSHAEFYSQLAKSTEGIPWDATFVDGKGYVSFN